MREHMSLEALSSDEPQGYREPQELHGSCGSSGLRAVLFDNDGTLVDTYELILESFRYALDAVAGTNLSDEEIMRKVGQPLFVQAASLVPDRPHLRDALVDAYRAHNEAVHDGRIRLFDGVQRGLAAMADKGLELGVVTSKRHALCQHGLEILGVDSYMACIVGYDDCTHYKPQPEPVQRGCVALGLDPQVCMYVGDSPYDLMAGNDAGCITVAVTWGMFEESELCGCNPDYVVHSFDELVDLALQLI